MDFEQYVVQKQLNNVSKKIHYESQFLEENTELNIPTDTDLVILNHSFANNHTTQQYELLRKKVGTKDFIYLTSNYFYWKNKHPNIIYFSFYFYFFLDLPYVDYDIKETRPYKLMCFNLNPWLHRTLNLLKISKKKWFDECKFSFHWTHVTHNSDTRPIGYNTIAELNPGQRNELDKFQFPIVVEDNWVLGGNFYVLNQSKLYGQVKIDYVTENNIKQEFITEKIWKPIFSGQLFYVLGPKNYIQHLRDLGIDVFDDYIDHSYDIEDDLDNKIDLILNDIDKIMVMDLDKIWNDTYQRRKNNFDLVRSKDFANKLCEDLIKKVS